MEKLDDIVFYMLERSIKKYRQYAQKRLIAAGHSITIDQWLVLSVIKKHPEKSIIEIAEKVFKDAASVSRIIDLLVRSRLLKRSVLEKDRRRFQINITPKGEKALKAVKPIVLENRKNALKGIRKTEIDQLNTLLNKIISNCHE
ncbi:MAG: MarR family transcriptional regulator [Flavobacteriales bacterium]|nr:MarR family transcriptional regulator [Flavobacteriales bacterium]